MLGVDMTAQPPQARTAKPSTDRANWLEDQIAWISEHWDDTSLNGLELGHEIVRTARALGHNTHLAMGLRFIANLNLRRSEHLTCLHYLVEALELFTALDNQRQMAACQNEIGSAYLALGDCADALEFFEASLSTSEGLNSQKGRQVNLMCIAQAQRQLGQLDQALEYAGRSLELVLESEDTHEASEVQSFIGEMHTLIGRRALETGAPETGVLETGVLGTSANDQAQTAFEMARVALSQSLERANLLANPEYQAMALTGLVGVLTDLERFDTASRFGQDALKIATKLPNPAVRARTLVAIGRLRSRADKPNQALESFKQALEVFETLGQRDEAAQVHRELANVYKNLEQFAPALQHFERFYELDAQVRSQGAERRAQALTVKVDLERAHFEAELHRVRASELSALNERLERQTREDGLTGLSNRRHLEEFMRQAFSAAQDHATALSVVLLDIDHFKAVNDRFSHATGDRVLQAVATLMREHINPDELAGRFGGEEFVLVLHSNPRDTYERAEKLRQAIQDYAWTGIEAGLEVTLSLGWSAQTNLENHERMLSNADAMLYAAKRAGRNRVMPGVF
jgi:diguanylate cyclase (GGDEF)-like protein